MSYFFWHTVDLALLVWELTSLFCPFKDAVGSFSANWLSDGYVQHGAMLVAPYN